MMSGYLNNAEASKRAFTQDGWYCTGDIGFVDEKNCLKIVGRIQDTFKYNNKTVKEYAFT